MGRRNRRRRFPQRGRDGGARRSAYAARIVVHDWEGYSAQRNYAAAIAANDWILAIDADERVPPPLAAEIQEIMRSRDQRRTATACRACRTISDAGSAARTGTPTTSCASTIAASAGSTASACTSRSSCSTGTAVDAAERPAALPLPRHLRSRHQHRPLHRRWRPKSGSARAGAPTRSRSWCIRRRRSCATTSCGAGSATGPPASSISSLNSYYVFLKILKLWELQNGYRPADNGASGAGEHPTKTRIRARAATWRTADCPGQTREPRRRRSRALLSLDVLAAHRHGADLARRPEPGARHRARPARDSAIARCSSPIRTASCGERAREGLDLIPLAPRTEMDLRAAWRLSRLLKQLRPDVVHAHDPHGVAMAGLALSMSTQLAEAAARRVAARRLPSTQAARCRAGSIARSTASSAPRRRSGRCSSPTACRGSAR